MKRSPIARKSPLRPGTRRMRRTRSTGKPTIAQSDRIDRIKHMGCIACYINRKRGLYDKCPVYGADAHHLLSGGRRIGHDATIPLCPFHHRSMPPVQGMSLDDAVQVYGPTLERQKAFRDYYGTDAELLAMTNALLEIIS